MDIANSRIMNLAILSGFRQCRLGTVPDGEHFSVAYLKTGSGFYGSYFRNGSTGQGISTVSDIVYMNGTTDYLELYLWNSYSSALPLVVGESFQNYISIVGPL